MSSYYHQCRGTTKRGVRCQNSLCGDRRFCSKHTSQASMMIIQNDTACIPDDVFRCLILPTIPLRDLICHIAFVCSLWKTYVYHEQTWSHSKINLYNGQPFKNRSIVYQMWPYLKNIRFIANMTASSFVSFCNCSNFQRTVRTLSICCDFIPIMEEYFKDGVSLDALQTLHVTYLIINPDMKPLIRACPNVKSLLLGNSSHLISSLDCDVAALLKHVVALDVAGNDHIFHMFHMLNIFEISKRLRLLVVKFPNSALLSLNTLAFVTFLTSASALEVLDVGNDVFAGCLLSVLNTNQNNAIPNIKCITIRVSGNLLVQHYEYVAFNACKLLQWFVYIPPKQMFTRLGMQIEATAERFVEFVTTAECDSGIRYRLTKEIFYDFL